MKTLIQDGRVVEVTAPYVAPAGQGVLVGTLFGVAMTDIANGAKGDLLMQGVVEIAKTSALAISAGARVFWDDTNKVVNTTAAAQLCVGRAVEAAVNPSPTVKILLGAVTPAGT